MLLNTATRNLSCTKTLRPTTTITRNRKNNLSVIPQTSINFNAQSKYQSVSRNKSPTLTLRKHPKSAISANRSTTSSSKRTPKIEPDSEILHLTNLEAEKCYFKYLPVIRKIAYQTLKRYKPQNASASDSVCIFDNVLLLVIFKKMSN